jgi:hypothetical protein
LVSDLFDRGEPIYPAFPGVAKASETSREAAEAIAPFASNWRGKVARLFFEQFPGDFMADQAARELGATPFMIRPRVTELAAAVYVPHNTATPTASSRTGFGNQSGTQSPAASITVPASGFGISGFVAGCGYRRVRGRAVVNFTLCAIVQRLHRRGDVSLADSSVGVGSRRGPIGQGTNPKTVLILIIDKFIVGI